MGRRIESLLLAGPAGRLEALLEEPEQEAPRAAALVCHPHPRHGGTMHNKVVHRLARGLRRAGAAVLRFNYRGVNRSAGEYGHGRGEVDDARAALAALRGRYPGLPYTLAGFSFGARIVLKLGGECPDAARNIAAGLPTGSPDLEAMIGCAAPLVIIQSTHDEYGPRASLEAYAARLRGEHRLLWVAARDHFFAGALEVFEETVYRVAS